MTIHTDFNTAESSSYDLIPTDTIATATLDIRKGNHMSGFLNKNEMTGSIGLKAEFTITSGEYQGRKIFQLIGIEGMKKDEEGNDKWGGIGRRLIRSILESARGVSSKDETPAAVIARKISSYSELKGLSCLVKIGIEEDKTGKYDDKNKVIKAITPDNKEYSKFMKQTPMQKTQSESTAESGSIKDSLDDEIPF